MDRIYAEMSEITQLYEIELPDGRQLIDISGYELVQLADLYRCPVEVVFERPRVIFLPLKQINAPT